MSADKEKTIHSFVPGDNWMYYKIYCGMYIADKLIRTRLSSIIRKLYDEQLIEKWFFIRYDDPDHHIRLRFKLLKEEQIGEVLSILKDALKDWIENDLIWRISLDTYQRELQRYYEKTIDLSEHIFFLNSELVLSFLNNTNANDDYNRVMFSLKQIDTILNRFNYDLKAKRAIIESYLNAYLEEFNSNSKLKKQLSKKYKLHEPKIEELFYEFEDETTISQQQNSFQEQLQSDFRKTANRIVSLCQEEKTSTEIIDRIAKSHLHMFVNRLFSAQQRKYELVIYYMLYRYYSKLFFRN